MSINRWNWDPHVDMVPSEEGEYVRTADHDRVILEHLASMQGYVDAFYELARMLSINAQPSSPKEVWETQTKPLVKALVELVEACEWHEIDEHGYAPAVAVSKALALVKKVRS